MHQTLVDAAPAYYRSIVGQAEGMALHHAPVEGSGRIVCILIVQEDEVKLDQALEEGRRRVHGALLDSLNLAGAMEALGELVRAANKYMDKREAQSAASPPGARQLVKCTPCWRMCCCCCCCLPAHASCFQ